MQLGSLYSQWNLSSLSWSTRRSTTWHHRICQMRRLPARCHHRAPSASIIGHFQLHCHLYTSSRLGNRAFAAAGPRLCNSLPTHVRQLDLSLDTFHRKLKTYSTVRDISAGVWCFVRPPLNACFLGPTRVQIINGISIGLAVFGRPFVKRFALCYRAVVSPVCPVCKVGVLWTNGFRDVLS